MNLIGGKKTGQVSIELFVAMSLFIVVLVWVNNYSSEYVTSIGTAANYQQTNAIATSVASVYNYGCAYNESITFMLPCATNEGSMVPVNVTSGNGLLTVNLPNNNVSVTRQLLCSGSNTLVYQCIGEDGPYACVTNYSTGIALSFGKCNNTTI